MDLVATFLSQKGDRNVHHIEQKFQMVVFWNVINRLCKYVCYCRQKVMEIEQDENLVHLCQR